MEWRSKCSGAATATRQSPTTAWSGHTNVTTPRSRQLASFAMPVSAKTTDRLTLTLTPTRIRSADVQLNASPVRARRVLVLP